MTETTLWLVDGFGAGDRGLVEPAAAAASRRGRSTAASATARSRILRANEGAKERGNTQRESQRCTGHDIS
jgi:hypothetical protein